MNVGPTVSVQLQRSDARLPWGFRLQGGRDYRMQLSIKKVEPGSVSQGYLNPGDSILAINGKDTRNLSHLDAQQMIKRTGNQLVLTVQRNAVGLSGIAPQGPVKFQPYKAQQVGHRY